MEICNENHQNPIPPFPTWCHGAEPGGSSAEPLRFGAVRAAACATEPAEPRAETGVPRSGGENPWEKPKLFDG